jgi:hypothetical protein
LTSEQAKKLRAPFPDEQVGKLPRVWCKACSENKQQRHCGQHSLVNCQVCGNKITEAHLHLDYVGHAATTDRLLQVDPNWTWQPMAVGPNGEPLVTNGGLWITLTICDVTRPGFGDGKNPKEIIGDAIRNAAMRFGVALDLWAKEDLNGSAGDPQAEVTPGADSPTPASAVSAAPEDTDEQPSPADATVLASEKQRRLIFAKKTSAGITDAQLKLLLVEVTGQDSTKAIPAGLVDEILYRLVAVTA